MTGAVYERVNEAVSHFNPVNVTMECVLKGWGGVFFERGGLSVMRLIVLGQNKANMCTNSTVMEELVCLSSKWNILKASNPAE